MNIVETAVKAGSFKTLAKALTEAGLVDALSGKGPFTVFAPNDEAFAKVPAETLNALLADKEKLVDVLKYHVVPGKLMARDVLGMSLIKTLQGSPVTVSNGQSVMIQDAILVKTDIEADNGVIHVIDSVLMPE